MSKQSHQPRDRWTIAAPIVLTILAMSTLVGCGDDWVVDSQAGFIDLVPFFRGPVNAADPTALLPRTLPVARGWAAGSRVEAIDFGAVTVPRKFDAKGSALRIPDTARVFPMYFFFDSSGHPMYSKPLYDTKTGVWSIRGGHDPLTPTPIDPPVPGAEPQRSTYYGNINIVRPRQVLADRDRGGSRDFQRPVIDTLLDDPNYTGLYEIVEVTIKGGGFTPDSIKSVSTINAAVADGKASLQRTGKVINCPIVDERTFVTPSAMTNAIPRPRIELWYRRMYGTCYLANGWETLGEAIDETVTPTDPNNLRLFQAGVDIDKRVDTFDVLRTTLGSGSAQTQAVTVPVARLFVPTLVVPSNNQSGDLLRTRYSNDDLTLALPRHKSTDAGGYSPIVWVYDLNVRQDPPYSPGTYRDYGNVDPTLTVARDGDTTVVTRNYAITGIATKCVSNADCRLGQQCNPMPDINIATVDPPPGQNLADVVIAREGGARCDVPVATFGGFCAPGVARCDVQAPVGSDNEKALKALGVAVAGPAFTIHADLATAKTSLANSTSLAMGVDPAMPMRMVTMAEQATAMAALPGLQTAADNLTARVAYYDGLGFTADLAGYGYLCYPQNGTGYCAIRCDSVASSTNVTVKTQLPVADGMDASKINATDYTFNTEARCGGTNMLGYRCLPTTVLPERQRVCLRECKLADTQFFNRALCDYPLNIKPDAMGGTSTAYSLGEGLPARTTVTGQTCTSIVPFAVSGVTASAVVTCSWNPDFEPRDPNVWPGQ
jgi:hypothetical protein